MTVKEMKARLREINAEANKIKAGDTDGLNKLLIEAEDLEAKILEAENRSRLQKLADGASNDDGRRGGESGDDFNDSAKKRGEALLHGKKIRRKFEAKNTITSTQTVLTQHTANDVNPTFNEVSSLVDRVKTIYLPGGESYRRGFVKSYGNEGDYTAEGADYSDTEPTFGYSEMVKTKITAYCEEPEEIVKLAPAEYSGVIEGSVETAIKKKLTRQILIGEGGSGKLYGIFYNPASPADDIIDRNTDIALTEIDENTLDDIVYSYGGDEDVEDVACLILNKSDLKTFAKCRKADGDKAYNVVNHGNTGFIDSIPYIINSACGAISKSDTPADTYCMAYGPLSNYEMPVFSDMDIQHSTEYKFKQGQIAHRGDIFVGGNVAAHNGFLRIKKSS